MSTLEAFVATIGLLYAGTGFGVWISIGNNWKGLPHLELLAYVIAWPKFLWDFHDEIDRGDSKD